MKKTAYPLSILVLITIIINGCKKTDLATVPGGKSATYSLNADQDSLRLIVTKSTVSQNYPDTIRIAGTKTADSIYWTVSPSQHTNTLLKTNSLFILTFTSPGIYHLKAILNGADSVATSITVTDSLSASATYHLAPLTADINITPHFHSGNSPDSSYLYFTAQTSNAYPCSSCYLESGSFLTSTKNFIVTFDGAECPDAPYCAGGGTFLTSTISFNGYHQNYITDTASYPLKIVLNNDSTQTYKGHILFTPSKINFEWNYNSGVVLTTKTINR